jgi:TP901 family phage tail tape measure protein
LSFDLTAVLRLNSQQFNVGMRSAQRSMNGMRSGVGSIVKQLGLMTSAAGAVGLAVSSINKSAEFEQQMSKVGAIADASGADLARLKDSAMGLGASTSKSATEVAQAMESLAAKGFDTNKIIGAMPGIINAATASGEDLAMVSDVVTSALNAFGLKASAATHVADVMSLSANKTAAGVEDLGYSFKYAAPVAKGLGIKLEELAAATGMMVDKGLAGEQAGTSLRMGLMRLASAPEKASKAMDKLGFSAVDSHNKFKSISTITTDLRNKMQGLTQAQKVQTLGTIFGTEAATGWLDLVDSAPGKMQKMTNELVNSNGKAKETSAKMMSNMRGSVELLKGSFETLQLKVTTGLLPVISSGAKELSKWMDSIKPAQIQAFADSVKSGFQTALTWSKNVFNFITQNWPAIRETLIAVTAGVVVFKSAMAGLMIIQTITKMVYGLRVAYGVLTGAQWALNAAEDANPVGAVILAIAALIAISVLLVRNWDKVKAVWSTVWNAMQRNAATSINFLIGRINAFISLIDKIPGVNIPLIAKVDWGKSYKLPGAAATKSHAVGSGAKQLSAYDSGISRIGSDGPIYAHKGERVLTREENKAYSNGGGGNPVSITMHYHATGNTEADARNMLGVMARLIEREGVPMR